MKTIARYWLAWLTFNPIARVMVYAVLVFWLVAVAIAIGALR